MVENGFLNGLLNGSYSWLLWLIMGCWGLIMVNNALRHGLLNQWFIVIAFEVDSGLLTTDNGG